MLTSETNMDEHHYTVLPGKVKGKIMFYLVKLSFPDSFYSTFSATETETELTCTAVTYLPETVGQ